MIYGQFFLDNSKISICDLRPSRINFQWLVCKIQFPGPFNFRPTPFQMSAPFQGRGTEAAPSHRDEEDLGRMQCVVALSHGAFDVWPGSHKICAKKAPCGGEGHYHLTDDFKKTLHATCSRVVFSSTPGDVLLFVGGLFNHGSPAIGGPNPSPRIVTYATFWPPCTKKGQLHVAGQCGMPHCGGFSSPNAKRKAAGSKIETAPAIGDRRRIREKSRR